jgi:hypothetical protein
VHSVREWNISIAIAKIRNTLITETCFWGEDIMLRTISIGSCVFVQGPVVAQLADGKVVIKVDERNYVGVPVTSVRAA